MLDQVIAVALRPFLARCADVWMARVDPVEWNRPWCLLCGGEPDFAVLPAGGDRWLICGRCTAQWPFSTGLPVLRQGCSRRHHVVREPGRTLPGVRLQRMPEVSEGVRCPSSGRPVMPGVDTIATLPLDAAAIQRGYDG